MLELVIVGATFRGIGLCIAHTNNSLIIEPRSTVGYEFFSTYKDCAQSGFTPKTELGKALHSAFPPPYDYFPPQAFPFLCKAALRLPLQLMTKVISVKSFDNYYELELYSPNGTQRVCAKKIVDTTEGISLQADKRPKIVRKSLNYVVWRGKPVLVKQKVPAHCGYMQARRMIVEQFEGRGTIAVVADCFDITLASNSNKLEIAQNFWLDSAWGYDNPFAALEE